MNSDTTKPAQDGPDDKASGNTERHTPQGAPTDQAHRDAGDGALTGSVPAGLTTGQLEEAARSDKTDDSGAE